VKKKAALTLLRLYRKHPDIVQPQWAERIISLMDDVDLGVALSVTSLVSALAQDNLEQYKGAYAKAAAKLKRIVIDGDYSADYLYYKVPCPWIQVKLLRLLQYFPPSGTSDTAQCVMAWWLLTALERRQPCEGYATGVAPKDPQPGPRDKQERAAE
jgi:AP-2 complex subunit alpha